MLKNITSTFYHINIQYVTTEIQCIWQSWGHFHKEIICSFVKSPHNMLSSADITSKVMFALVQNMLRIWDSRHCCQRHAPALSSSAMLTGMRHEASPILSLCLLDHLSKHDNTFAP